MAPVEHSYVANAIVGRDGGGTTKAIVRSEVRRRGRLGDRSSPLSLVRGG